MVLSNKKLKQKLRTQLAESLTKPDTTTHESFKSLLTSATQKPKLSKREIRRVKVPSADTALEVKDTKDGEVKENKKRKREKDDGEVKDVSKSKKSNKHKKKKKKNNKKTKVVKKDGNEEGVKIENVVSEEKIVEVGIETQVQAQISKEEESNSTKVYVGGIPYYSTVDDIRSFFEGCGTITEIDCLKFPETGKFNGIAFLSFRTEAAAKRALALDGSDMGGLSLKVQPYKATREKKVSDFSPAMLEGYNRIYVGNLSWDMTEEELKKFFSDCNISSVRLGKDKETGEFKGFAHVDFVDSLSLTMSLKLDQKPLFGRPVRIRCAVPRKSVNPSSTSDSVVSKNDAAGGTLVVDDVAKRINRTCYECGEKGHLSSMCPNKKVDDVAPTSYKTGDAAFDNEEADNTGDGKLKRRTCYECGDKGHISSLCPNKKAADVAHTGYRTDDVAFDKEEVDNIGDGKLKRRTCYECGEKGHISSLCPKKQVADVTTSVRETPTYVAAAENERFDYNTINSVSDGKLRRRTCYECGERGHLSSLCPNKQVVDVGKDMEVKKVEVVKTVAPVVKENGDNAVSSVSEGKLRRRTCYECGERGHLSSLCPKKQTADEVVSKKEVIDMEVEKVEEVKSVAVIGNEGDDNVPSSVSAGKLKRRNCYECGLKGHLSSLCPNKNTTAGA
ncbi:zinc finger, CCHC-type, Nucleotide-binding alpha-beta plait domain, Zinc knuckle CX2CX4HX4C [Artemisia annua]|uniref:Zinc finger, CCHC-type, Nucleotide-binding alpha-beta plait domain, Zinc knuckle CX2CX4HX4C n=1 Tax=Artemisia annua TaxID=35608 RepID=A0A2U1L6S6_ARTAN|nr:zinc finger, CCHC-type, Nucleotide-binding alpha-beta plait domain, Zinc knuckle CX2CX4HX4C [Artemisia annua]